LSFPHSSGDDLAAAAAMLASGDGELAATITTTIHAGARRSSTSEMNARR